METINNITAAASNAIFGSGEKEDPNNPNTTTSQTTGTGTAATGSTMSGTSTTGHGTNDPNYVGSSGREPISGQLGNTGAGEPYDRGNVEESSSTSTPYTAKTLDPRVHTGSNTSTSNTTSGSTNAGPYDSNLANKMDPRVDSDRDGSRTSNTGSSTLGGSSYNTGSSTTGRSSYDTSSTTSGPHSSNLANKADPRVDSDRDGSRTADGYEHDRSNTMGTPYGAGTSAVGGSSNLGSSSLGSSNFDSSSTSANAGPHSSNLANKADPRVDSDRDGSGIGGNTSGSNTGFYSSTSTNPLTSRPAGDYNTSSTSHHTSSIGGVDSLRSTDDRYSSSSGHHGSNTGIQSTYGSTTGDTSLSVDGSDSINPGPTGSHVGKETTDASKASRTETGLKDGVNNTPNTRPFSEFGGNTSVNEADKTGIAFREPGPTPARGLHPIDGQNTMTGAHSHRGSGAFQNTQDTHDTLHKRDHLDNADHTQDRSKSTDEGNTTTGGVSGKGTPGGMPEVIAKDLEKIKTGHAKPPGGSDAELGLDEAHGGPSSGSKAAAHDGHHGEKVGMMDKIKAKLHK